MNDMIRPLRRYFDFRGRSRRREFWLWYLFVIIAFIVLSVVDTILGLGGSATMGRQPLAPGAIGYNYAARTAGGVLTGVFGLAVIIPNVAVSVRRLHDTNRRGWWLLLPVLPYIIGAGFLVGGFIGHIGASATGGALAAVGGLFMLAGFICAIVVLVFYCLEGTCGPNRFGPDPKGSGETLGEVFR